MLPEVTFVFEGNQAYAIREGKVIAADTDLDALEQKVAFNDLPMGPGQGIPPDHGGGPTEMPPPPPGVGGQDEQAICHGCGHHLLPGEEVCPSCGEPIAGMDPVGDMHHPYPLNGDDGSNDNFRLPMASITTPNGLTGTILGKVAGLWSDEVTIRLENGRIVSLPVTKGMKVSSTQKTASTNPIERLESYLAKSPDGTRDSLVARVEILNKIGRAASNLIREGVSHTDEKRLDKLVVTADQEAIEVSQAIDHLDDEATQAYEPPAPFSVAPADQASYSMGNLDGSWLDEVQNDLIAEAESTDFKTLMDEGPEGFAAELPDAALADGGVVRQMASNFIRSKTAGTDPEIRDPYESVFLGRVEQCRRAELATRKQTTHKEAAAEEDEFTNLPDDAVLGL